MHRFRHIAALTFALLLLSACLCSCGNAKAAVAGKNGGYNIPNVRTTVFDQAEATSARGCAIDTSNAAAGYICAQATSASPLKFQVLCNGNSYNYDMPNDVTTEAFPLNMGDGTYTLRVMQKIEGNNYVQLLSTQVDVRLNSEFEPFLTPSIYCDFNAESDCVKKARELAANAKDQAAAAEAIYNWIVDNITYDTEKATQMKNATGYLPDPDETFHTKTGICFDYASLAAAMLRSVGIPTKIVTGYVADQSIYHAWNMVYMQDKWVNVSFTAPEGEWTRIDTTFDASGPQVVSGKDDYVDRFTY